MVTNKQGTTGHIYTDAELLRIYERLLGMGFTEAEARGLMVTGYPESREIIMGGASK